MEEAYDESRPLAFTPTWSIATVLSIFVAVSMLTERLIYYLSYWLRKTNRKPLLAALEKMHEEMMLLGFISLLLTATSELIANICIPLKLFNSDFAPCTKSEIMKEKESNVSKEHKLLMISTSPHLTRRVLEDINRNPCHEGYLPFLSYEDLEQLHEFIFIMAVTHISYSCFTMLLAIVKVRADKIHSWKIWEKEVHKNPRSYAFPEITRNFALQSQSTLVMFHRSNPLNHIFIYNLIQIYFVSNFIELQRCFLQQFWNSVHRMDYLTLRKGFIMKHKLTLEYDFHSYMIQSMEEEFENMVGVSIPLWGCVIAFMLFNIKVGTKLQHVIATLVLENAEITNFFSEAKLTPRDELFWFNKPELLLTLIHFIIFQNAFELASFFWFWWQFGYNSCFLKRHNLVFIKMGVGLIGQFVCSYSTLPLYALVTQMGTNFKAALIPETVRDAMDDWGKTTRKKRKQGLLPNDLKLQPLRALIPARKRPSRAGIHDLARQSLNHDWSCPSLHHDLAGQSFPSTWPVGLCTTTWPVDPCTMTWPVGCASRSRLGQSTPHLRTTSLISSSTTLLPFRTETIPRSSSMPREIYCANARDEEENKRS
ncbi:hypothetical protein VNO78_06420 [Psophocarpus tetragonolobus]|uniref:MLO-like protein n=1 Tax=Psophocarpus tetragonolobus TaxID=3891 RepID=A0AAN9SSF8_PSOTE